MYSPVCLRQTVALFVVNCRIGTCTKTCTKVVKSD